MAPPPRKKLPIQKRCRSVPFPKPFIKATIFTSFFLFSIFGLIAVVIAFALLQTQEAVFLVVAALFITLIFWTISLFVRRAANCPLCKGTPYFNSGAHTHEKATKLPLLNHGISNILRTITVQTFRCMYCGQPYDLLKPVTNPPPSSKRKKKTKGKGDKTQKRRRRSNQKTSLPERH